MIVLNHPRSHEFEEGGIPAPIEIQAKKAQKSQ